MENNQSEKTKKSAENYKQQKTDFLDSLQPDDFRNAGSFNQAELIIDELNKAFHRAVFKKENPQEFIQKAAKHLFRENSSMVVRAIELAGVYLEMIEGCK